MKTLIVILMFASAAAMACPSPAPTPGAACAGPAENPNYAKYPVGGPTPAPKPQAPKQPK